ncbi:MAG: flavodoxin [Candidatus Aminicenantes bacterium]|nr:flavodoxin [Candidatus Aminicenantes bacterium]NIM82853.1 flavodoxin [Candidatus Aminicenantes bacterium]NIN22229.1 flavodoxin [Candidatus Aminicenantes bacterium]NIN45997.1 flavodoxin [Candidatus Aminicenantes bacterium]NIN88833.1 flavodoxin [Candidatus Aminicenantes bacterium]
MSTLIAYATTHGCTEKAAQMLEQLLNDEVSLVNLKKRFRSDLSSFDTIIIGGSIHAGQIQGKVKRFYQEHLDTLKQKRLGLFLCCMEEGETAHKQFDEAFPAELRNHAAVTGLFGGAFDFDKMNFLQKSIVKKAAGINQSVSKIKEDNIHQFAALLNG